ncbi:MAG: hypothetical protein KDJ28_15485 [Candidatus Competibacteraceae bacterium]|nr:hypothetical protein [Candidatus Competibacteraceae bacterium]
MQTQHSSHSDKPESKALYVPGPFVAAIKTLIDAYRQGNAPALSAALQQLEQAVANAEPRSRSRSRYKPKSKPKALKKRVSVAAQERKPFKKAPMGMATTSREEADRDIDLVSCLNRDHPAIAERYARGEFRNIKEAAIAAGIIVSSWNSK